MAVIRPFSREPSVSSTWSAASVTANPRPASKSRRRRGMAQQRARKFTAATRNFAVRNFHPVSARRPRPVRSFPIEDQAGEIEQVELLDARLRDAGVVGRDAQLELPKGGRERRLIGAFGMDAVVGEVLEGRRVSDRAGELAGAEGDAVDQGHVETGRLEGRAVAVGFVEVVDAEAGLQVMLLLLDQLAAVTGGGEGTEVQLLDHVALQRGAHVPQVLFPKEGGVVDAAELAVGRLNPVVPGLFGRGVEDELVLAALERRLETEDAAEALGHAGAAAHAEGGFEGPLALQLVGRLLELANLGAVLALAPHGGDAVGGGSRGA